MPLALHNIKISQRSQTLIREAKAIGLGNLFQRIANDAMDLTANYGVDIAKSVVPVDTLELRDSQIRKGNKLLFSISVIVTDDTHIGHGIPQPASQLATILHSGYNERGRFMRRTRNSIPLIPGVAAVAARTPTKNWITLSDRIMTQTVQTHLNRIFASRVYV